MECDRLVPATITFNSADGKKLATKSYSNAVSATLMLTTADYRIEIQSPAVRQ